MVQLFYTGLNTLNPHVGKLNTDARLSSAQVNIHTYKLDE